MDPVTLGIIIVMWAFLIPMEWYIIHTHRQRKSNLRAHQMHFEHMPHEAQALQNLYDPGLPLPPIDDNAFED